MERKGAREIHNDQRTLYKKKKVESTKGNDFRRVIFVCPKVRKNFGEEWSGRQGDSLLTSHSLAPL